MAMPSTGHESPANGAGAAALLAAGIGTFLMGILTAWAEASATIKGLLVWYGPAGPLTGKTGVPVLAWLLIWAILHAAWRGKEVNFRSIYCGALTLILLGFLFLFPPVFEAFGR